MGCKNTQVWNWQCWGDPTDQGNAAAGFCFFHFIQCLSEWSWILHRSPASGKMFPLSPVYINSGPVSPGTWRGSSVSPGGVSVGLTSPEQAGGKEMNLCPLQLWGAWESLEKLQRGGTALCWSWMGRALPSRGVCSWRRGGPAPFPIFMENSTSYMCWNLASFRGVKILH